MLKPFEMALRVGDWERVGVYAQRIRQAVFVAEQGIDPELEWDEWDERSLHAVIFVMGEPAATGRLLPDGHVGRMAVLPAHRRKGLASEILRVLLAKAAERGDAQVELSAQSYIGEFYRAHGFEPVGEEYIEVGIPHRRMIKRLDGH